MCQLLELRSAIMTRKVTAISFVLIFCFAECAAGSCLSYGHSCWGAHGKRSGDNRLRDKFDPVSDTRWVLSRLVPMEVRSWKNQKDGLPVKHHPMSVQAFNVNDVQDEQDNNSDLQETLPLDEDVLYMDDAAAFRPRVTDDKLRLLKLMKKNAEKLN